MENEVLKKYSKDKSNLIEILNEFQDKYGYISLENQLLISDYLNVSMAEIYSVITFYSRFSLSRNGKYNISVCMGTACFVKGAKNLLEKLENTLNIKTGEVTSDGLFKIVENRCVGACSLAPVLIVNDEIYGNCTLDKLESIINDLRSKNDENF